jgi:integrase
VRKPSSSGTTDTDAGTYEQDRKITASSSSSKQHTAVKSKPEKLRGARGVYKRGDVWIAVVEQSVDPKTGRRKRTWLSGFHTRKEAEEARDRARSDRLNGIDITPDKLTVAGLATRYLADAKARVGAKTHEEYASLANRCIVPRLGSIPLAKLRPLHVQEAYAQMLTGGRANGKGGLSPTTVRHAHGLLKAMLSWAVRMQIVARNVTDAVDAPTRTRSEANSLTTDEIASLLDAVAGTRWETPFVLALATGMRRGEIAGLKWDAVDFDRATLCVRASLSQTRAGIALKSTKSGRVRNIPLAPIALVTLRERRRVYLAERLAAGGQYDDQRLRGRRPAGGSAHALCTHRRVSRACAQGRGQEAPSRHATYFRNDSYRERCRRPNGSHSARSRDPERHACHIRASNRRAQRRRRCTGRRSARGDREQTSKDMMAAAHLVAFGASRAL